MAYPLLQMDSQTGNVATRVIISFILWRDTSFNMKKADAELRGEDVPDKSH